MLIIRQWYWKADNLLLYDKQHNQDQSLPPIPGSFIPDIIKALNTDPVCCSLSGSWLFYVKYANRTFLSSSMEAIEKNVLN